MANKTNTGLVAFANQCADENRPYLLGTYGLRLSLQMLNAKRKQYPTKITQEKYDYAKAHFIGKRTDDCYALLKNYIWLPGTDAELIAKKFDVDPVYNAKQDINADTAFELATEKGTIDTIPEIPGIMVRYKGHAGVYVGNGIVVEERGFSYGCVRTRLNERKWTHWYKSTFITYLTSEVPSNAKKSIEEIAREVIADKWGVGADRKARLEKAGYNYREVQDMVNKILNNKTLTVTGVNVALNMRNQPSMNGAIIGSVPKGQKVTLLEKTTDKWYKVSYNGRTGYCWSGYLK